MLFSFLNDFCSAILKRVSVADIVKKGAKPDNSYTNLWKREDQLL